MRAWFLRCGWVAVLAVGCGDDGSGGATDSATGTAGSGGTIICEPGSQVDCGCPGGPPSVQTCSVDGTVFGACECPGMTSLPPLDTSSTGDSMTTSPPPTTFTTSGPGDTTDGETTTPGTTDGGTTDGTTGTTDGTTGTTDGGTTDGGTGTTGTT